jgi:hypothetical protein
MRWRFIRGNPRQNICQPMLKTLSRFTSRFVSRVSEQNTILDVDGRVEAIRGAMLDLLMEIKANQTTKIWKDVDHANDAQSLWHLRSDLSRLLGESVGEQDARMKMDRITELFRDVVPISQMPAPRSFRR